MTDNQPQKFETWALVEVFGHQHYAGKVTDQAVGGCNFVRVDVPEVPDGRTGGLLPAFTKLLGQGAIFSITPCTEATARNAAAQFRATPGVLLYEPRPSPAQVPRLGSRPLWDESDCDPEGE